ncbi:MAG TPA: ferredoxin [Pirellulales bacterium]
MPIVNFVNEKKQVQVPEGANLRKEALKAGVKLYNGINGYGAKLNEFANCHGFAHCGTCRVLITKGMENASPMGAWENVQFKFNPFCMFPYIGNEDKMRLSCCTEVRGDMDVVTGPPLNLTGESFFS